MNILLIRHGEIPSNVNKVYAGKSQESLTEKGVLQAEQVSGKLKSYKISSLYSSPIQRAIQTAHKVSETIGIDLQIDDSFRELELGPWEGMSEKDIAERDPEDWALWNTYPAELKLAGRETLDELLQRVMVGIRKLPLEVKSGNVVIVTHVAIIRVLLLWCAKKSLNLYKTIHVPNAEIFEINIDLCP